MRNAPHETNSQGARAFIARRNRTVRAGPTKTMRFYESEPRLRSFDWRKSVKFGLGFARECVGQIVGKVDF